MSSPHDSRRVLISGSSGLIGRRLVEAFRATGHAVTRLIRAARPDPDTIVWDPGRGTLHPNVVSGFDVVIHLAGEPIAGRWTTAKKRRILDSRVLGTYELASVLAAAPSPPRLFLSASGINFYGNCGDTILDETSPQGAGFLAEVSERWERATEPLAGASRVVHLRIGVVLAAEGGTLSVLLPLYRMGLGGTVGEGRGYVSWITLDDLVRVTQHLTRHSELCGAVNVVAPEPVTGRELTQALAKAVGKPALVPVPAWAMRLAMGEMAEETVLGSVRALPRRLLEDGFQFRDPTLAVALDHLGIHPR